MSDRTVLFEYQMPDGSFETINLDKVSSIEVFNQYTYETPDGYKITDASRLKIDQPFKVVKKDLVMLIHHTKDAHKVVTLIENEEAARSMKFLGLQKPQNQPLKSNYVECIDYPAPEKEGSNHGKN